MNTNPGTPNPYLMYDPCPECGHKDVRSFEYNIDGLSHGLWTFRPWTFRPCGCMVEQKRVQNYYAFRFDTKERYNKEARTHELRKAAEERRKKS